MAKNSKEGPSPLARGNRRPARAPSRRRGSIPARAGQPSSWRSSSTAWRVHPRSRGATANWPEIRERILGPSPLARGNRRAGQACGGHDGSIPARAGQPAAAGSACRTGRVHPRSRGATAIHPGGLGAGVGPSPLARGNPHEPGGRQRSHGSIPARAGQPTRSRRWPRHEGVHPRSRGATERYGMQADLEYGPSPLARGNHELPAEEVDPLGSIPARAGQPIPAIGCTSATRVHPRSRGATGISDSSRSPSSGPSPLARGNLSHVTPSHARENCQTDPKF